jgi:hypothetical protein
VANNTFIVHIELPDDTAVDRAELEHLLVGIAEEITKGGVCRPVKDREGKRVGYWAMTPEKLNIDFFNKHRSS